MCISRIIGLVHREFANGPGDLGSISGRVIPESLKMVLGISLLNTKEYNVRIEGKVEQSKWKELRRPLHLGVVAVEKGAFYLLKYSYLILLIWSRLFVFKHSYQILY